MIANRYSTVRGLGVVDFLGFEVDCTRPADGCPPGYMRESSASSACVPSGNVWDVRQRAYCPTPGIVQVPAPPGPTTAAIETQIGAGSGIVPGAWTPEQLEAARQLQLAGYNPYAQYAVDSQPAVLKEYAGVPLWVWLVAGGLLVWWVARRN